MALPSLPSMGNPLKFILPVLLIIAGVIGVSQLYGQLQQKKQELARSRQEIAQLTSENESIRQQLESAQAEVKNREERLASLRTQLSSMTTDLERSRVSLQEMKERYEQLSQEREQVQSQVVSTASERDDARKQLANLEKDNAELERAVSRLRERLALLDRDYSQLAERLARMQDAPNAGLSVVSTIGPTTGGSAPALGMSSSSIPGTVELPPIIVRKDQAMMPTPVHGRLMEVNEPHNFVIVDKGTEDGVRMGSAFDILRGTGTIGRVVVVRVRPHLSACDIVRAKTPGPLQVGDLAVESGS